MYIEVSIGKYRIGMGRGENFISLGFFYIFIIGDPLVVVVKNVPVGLIMELIFVLLKRRLTDLFCFGEVFN
jgi:hypothetical protein